MSLPHFFTHPGIGDTGWLFQKLQDNLDDFKITVADFGPRRSNDYINLLGCSRVGYSKLHTPDEIYNLCLPHDTDLTKLDYSKPQVLSVNGWMEAGNRIDDWLPQYPTKYRLDFNTSLEHKLLANGYLDNYPADGAKRIVLYTSSAENNAHQDVNFLQQ